MPLLIEKDAIIKSLGSQKTPGKKIKQGGAGKLTCEPVKWDIQIIIESQYKTFPVQYIGRMFKGYAFHKAVVSPWTMTRFMNNSDTKVISSEIPVFINQVNGLLVHFFRSQDLLQAYMQDV